MENILIKDILTIFLGYLDDSTICCFLFTSKFYNSSVNFLFKNRIVSIPDPSKLSEYAAKKGYFEQLKWFHEYRFPFPDDICARVAVHGNMDINWMILEPLHKLLKVIVRKHWIGWSKWDVKLVALKKEV